MSALQSSPRPHERSLPAAANNINMDPSAMQEAKLIADPRLQDQTIPSSPAQQILVLWVGVVSLHYQPLTPALCREWFPSQHCWGISFFTLPLGMLASHLQDFCISQDLLGYHVPMVKTPWRDRESLDPTGFGSGMGWVDAQA